MLHQQFNLLEMPSNIRVLKRHRLRLPSPPIHQHQVPIDLHKSSSTSLPLKKTYTLFIIDHIQQVLNNPKLLSQMYFGPGVEEQDKREFWHGKIWSESPLFSEDTLRVTFPGT